MRTLITLILLTSLNALAIDPMTNYQTSNIDSFEKLNQLFKSLNRNYKRLKTTQCFNRAHYWSYQMYRNENIYSQKVFIYFTKKYKREVHGAWWFHVAPGVYYQNKLHILDPEFLKSAVPFEAWKNGAIDHAIKKLTRIKLNYDSQINKLNDELNGLNLSTRYGRKRSTYIKNRLIWLKSELKRMLISDSRIIPTTKDNWPYNDNRKEIIELDCPVVTNYSEFKNAQDNAYCYIQHTNMFVWEPGELERLETESKNKIFFEDSEVFTAFKQTFKGSIPYRLEQHKKS